MKAERELPHDIDAEESLLGSIVLLSDCIDEVAEKITPADFWLDSNRTIFEHMLKFGSGKKFDSILLTKSLKNAGDFDRAGGAAHIGKIVNRVPNAAHVHHYADIVRDSAIRRELIRAAEDVASSGYFDREDVAGFIAESEAKIFAASSRAHETSSRAVDISQLVTKALEDLERRAAGGTVRGIPTGFSGLDELTGGLQPGEVTIVAGRTSMGKTALAMNIARHVAEELPVTMFSLEMDAASIADRMLSMVAKVDLGRMRDGTLTADDRSALVDAACKCNCLQLRIDDAPGRSVQQIAAVCRRHQRKHGLSLVVIDYLQLLSPENHREQREAQVSKMSRGVKALARELKVPIICLAQLNRQTTTSKDNRPALSHLRESGAIEQDADVVIFPHRPDYYTYTKGSGYKRAEEAVLIVAKNRNGPQGEAKVMWVGAHASYESRAEDRYEPPTRCPILDAANEPDELREENDHGYRSNRNSNKVRGPSF